MLLGQVIGCVLSKILRHLINGSPIKKVITCIATSLGVLIDYKLIWSSHMLGLVP